MKNVDDLLAEVDRLKAELALERTRKEGKITVSLRIPKSIMAEVKAWVGFMPNMTQSDFLRMAIKEKLLRDSRPTAKAKEGRGC
jgi:hypothetical protein